MSAPGVACPHRPACAGCPWVDRPYPAQLAAKHARVRDALLAAFEPRALPEIRPVAPAPATTGYRVQAKLVVHATRNDVQLGLYDPGTHRVRDARHCPLHDPVLQRAIPAVADALARERLPIHGARGERGVRYVLFRASTREGRVLVTLVTSQMPLPGVARVARRLRAALPLAGLLLNLNRSAGNVIIGPHTTRVWGAPILHERYGALTLAAGPTAFVQANTRMAAQMYAAIADAAALREGARVADLYCGMGGIALTLARTGAAVQGVEEVEAAVRAARENARRNALAARFTAAPVERALAGFERGGLDLVTLNPPRSGCGAAVARAIAGLGAPHVLYLSCGPESFARDAGVLAELGFRLEWVQPFDLMPHTDQVELLGSFRSTQA